LQFDTSEKNLLNFVKTVSRPRHLAFEETTLSQWLFVLFKDHVDDLAIAHAAHLPKQRGVKDDFIEKDQVATSQFIGQGWRFKLEPKPTKETQKPSFIWEYDLSTSQIKVTYLIL